MRRLLLSFLTILSVLAVTPATGTAQEPGAVRLTLLSQTPWNSTSQRELLVRFRAENLGAVAIEELSIGVTLYGRVISRTEFEASLSADPSIVIDAETLPRDGSLSPDEPRDLELSFPLDSPGLDPDDSGIYPLKIELRTGFTSLAAIRTGVVFLVREPELPLSLSWTFVLDHPIAFGPDDVFTSTALEGALGPEGRLAAQVRALLGLATDETQPPVDVAVSPLLLTQLGRMRDGYTVTAEEGVREVPVGEGGAQLAQQAIEALSDIAGAPNVRVSALPFSSPELPSLLSGGLGRDLAVQLARGREIVNEVLGSPPLSTVLRPPGAALDESTLDELSGSGVATLVAGPATVEPASHPLGFAGPPTAALGRDGGLVAIVPEPSVMAILQSSLPVGDPVLAAQVVLAELATIWQERPGEPRGIALVVSEDLFLPPPFYGAFARGVAGAPWLAPMNAGAFTAAFPPSEPAALTAPTPRRFTETYVAELKQARRWIDTYRSMLVEPSDAPDRYDTMLLLAESRQYLSDPLDGLAFISAVRDSVGAVFDAVTVASVPEITLTSSTGSGIPVTVSNGAEETLRVDVQLSSPVLGSESIELELDARDTQTVTFRVDAQRTGRFQVALQVRAPGGRLIDAGTIDVRSTAYNRIALAITIAAALLLLALWTRRLVRRRTS